MVRYAVVVIALGAASGGSCHRSAAGSERIVRDTAARDSIRGRLEIVGTAEMPDVVLVPMEGGRAIALCGPLLPELQTVDGLGVDVVGRRNRDGLWVDRFTVVSANGLPATDGVLTGKGDMLVLVTADGRRYALVQPSPVLRTHIGRRIWVSGSLNEEPVGYGIIK